MAETWLEPYEEAIGEFPAAGSDLEKFHAALGWAVRAPSVHNTQPWRFRVTRQQVEIALDRTRLLPEADPDGREAVISCGAAIEYLHLTLRRFGYDAPVAMTQHARSATTEVLAVVSLGLARRVDPSDRRLFEAIPRRITNRRPFRRRAVPEAVLARAVHRAAARGVRLLVATDIIDRAVLADFISDADRVQLANPAFRQELARWLRSLGSRAKDGIPSVAGKGPRLVKSVAPLVVRTFDLGRGVAAIDRAVASGSPVLATLWSATDGIAGWVATGRGLARVLLSLAADHVDTSFLNQPLEVADLRTQIRDLYRRDGDFPQVIIRAGYGPPVPPTPRRPVSDVLG